MTLAVLFDIEPNPDSELLAKVMLEKFLKSHGVVKDGEDVLLGYKEVIVYEENKNNANT
jgi:hypothetical protein